MTFIRTPQLLGSTLVLATILAGSACKKTEATAPDAAITDAAALLDAAAIVDAAPPVDADVVDAAAAHAHAGPLALPGACVDPAADAKGRLGGSGVSAMQPDLDGDGKADTILSATSKDGTTFAIYVMRGACGHFVGTLKSGTLVAEKSKSHGLDDIHGNTPCKTKCNCTTQDFTAHFNGSSYFQGAITENFITCPPGKKP